MVVVDVVVVMVGVVGVVVVVVGWGMERIVVVFSLVLVVLRKLFPV